MPELPEVQTVVNDLERKITGKVVRDITIITSSIWRSIRPPKRSLNGVRIASLERKGKHILVHLSSKYSLVFHLKMTGKLIVCDSNDPIAKHTHLILKFTRKELRFNDVRRFGFVDFVRTAQLSNLNYLVKLGPDALEISKNDFISLIKNKNGKIKSVLLDQNSIAGLGNIYTDEILFASRINPARAASKISAGKLNDFYKNMNATLKKAIKARGSSVSDYVDGSGNKGGFQKHHKVYGKTGEPCAVCGSKIRRIIVSGRSTHYCPRCQR